MLWSGNRIAGMGLRTERPNHRHDLCPQWPGNRALPDSTRRRLRPHRTPTFHPFMWWPVERRLPIISGCRWRAARGHKPKHAQLRTATGDCTPSSAAGALRACRLPIEQRAMTGTGLQVFNKQMRRQDCSAAALNVPSDLARRHRRPGVCRRAFQPAACAQVHGSVAVRRQAASIRRLVRSRDILPASERYPSGVRSSVRNAVTRCPLSNQSGNRRATSSSLRGVVGVIGQIRFSGHILRRPDRALCPTFRSARIVAVQRR
jgi:hypothetical protein